MRHERSKFFFIFVEEEGCSVNKLDYVRVLKSLVAFLICLFPLVLCYVLIFTKMEPVKKPSFNLQVNGFPTLSVT